MGERRLITVTRDVDASGPLGTFGHLTTGNIRRPTLERPRVGDHPCIPAGEYDVDWTVGIHPHHPECYEIMRVPGRTAILIHAANWYQELLGCLALGEKIEIVEGNLPPSIEGGRAIRQIGVSSSGTALREFIADLKKENFRLIIKEA